MKGAYLHRSSSHSAPGSPLKVEFSKKAPHALLAWEKNTNSPTNTRWWLDHHGERHGVTGWEGRGLARRGSHQRAQGLASNSRSTFEATKTCKRRSECLRKISLRLELNIIKIKVRFHLHNLEKIFLVYQEHRTHAMGTDILTVLILHIKQTLDNMFIL